MIFLDLSTLKTLPVEFWRSSPFFLRLLGAAFIDFFYRLWPSLKMTPVFWGFTGSGIGSLQIGLKAPAPSIKGLAPALQHWTQLVLS